MDEIKGLITAVGIVIIMVTLFFAIVTSAAVLVPILVTSVLVYMVYAGIMHKNKSDKKNDLF